MIQHAHRRALVTALVGGIFSSPAFAQTPLDLFTDVPTLGGDYVRIGAWNLRHINLEAGADGFLPGADEQTDFQILTATFGKAIVDLGMDLVAIVEHQARANEPNRLHEIRDWLNANSGTAWSVDETAIEYEDPSNPFGNLQFGFHVRPGNALLSSFQRAGEKSPALAGVLSFVLPGVGSFYAGHSGHGIRHVVAIPVVIGATAAGLAIANKDGGEFETAEAWVLLGGAAALLVNGIWSIVTAVHDANTYNRRIDTAAHAYVMPVIRQLGARRLAIEIGHVRF